MAESSDDIRHDSSRRRFTLETDGATAVLDYSVLDAATLDYRHTFVPTASRGRGIASRLTEHALRYAREHGLKVVPTCPFVAAFIARHPEYRSLLQA